MKKNRVLYFDILNILACFSVVALHCHGSFFEFKNTTEWYVTAVVQILAHWAVPVFFMLTGATLLDYRKKYDTVRYFKRRVQRIVIPFLVWSTIFLIKGLINGTHQYMGMRDLITKYLNGEILGIYWFFYPLFAVYLSIPILSVMTEEKNKKILEYAIAVSFLMYSFAPVISILTGITYNWELQLPAAGGYIPYVLLGYYISHNTFERKYRYMVYAAGAVGAAGMGVFTYIYTLRDGYTSELFLDYKYCFTYFMAAAVFELCKNIPWKKFLNEKAQKIVTAAAGASFGVYLIHIFVVEKYFEHVHGNIILCMEAGTIFVFTVCVLIVVFVKKIPGFGRIFP